MKQRYITKNNTLKTRFLTLTLLTLMIGGGMKAIGQNAYSLNHTSGNTTYYVISTNDVASSLNNTTESGPQAYKFYVSSTPNTPSSATKYDHFYNVKVTGGSVTFIFQTTKPVGFANGASGNQNAFRVEGGTLTLKLDPDKYSSEVTLRRVGANNTFSTTTNTNTPFFTLASAGPATDKRMIIEGLPPREADLVYPASGVDNDTATFVAGRQFVIDNAANISSVSMTDGMPTYTGKTGKLPIFRIQTGTLHLTNVTLQNSIDDKADGNAHNGVYVMTNNVAGYNVDLKLTHCWLNKLVSKMDSGSGYPGIGIQYQVKNGNGRCDVLIERSKLSNISDVKGNEAAIRSISSCTAYVTLDRSTIFNNFGGGIRWQGLPAKQPLQVQYTTIKGNYSKENGGGIMAKAPINLVATKILNNKAYQNGGGINYMSFNEAGQTVDAAGIIYPKNLSLTMDAATIIDGNEAETGNGGGIMVWGRLINLTASGQLGYIYHEYDDDGVIVGPYKMELNLNGATIQNNKAYNNGGGIYIVREPDASCYLIDCKLSYGNITSNKASTGNGGGVCINQTGTPTPAHVNDDHPAKDISLTTGGVNYDITIKENDAYLDGGGIYLYSINDDPGWNEYQKFQTIVTLKDRTKIKENTAYTTATTTADTDHGGGGLFVQQGNVTIAGTEGAGEANNPLFEENKTQYSGAGICLIKGNIRAEYSRILSNETTTNKGRGGGVYLKEGTIRFDHSKINSNTAMLHGGGIFCKGDGENPWIDFFNSEMKANYAYQHGGGIYINSGEININSSTIGGTSIAEGNNAGSDTGGRNGGGIYTQDGNVKIDHSYIKYNFAARRGGGIYTKSGPVTITSSEICYNQAGYRKANSAATTASNGNSAGTGGGVHTDGGLVTINPNEDEDATLKTIVNNNKARLNGGGIFTGKDDDTKGKVAVYGNHDSQGGHLIEIKDNEAVNGSGGGIFCLGDADGDRYVLLRRVDLSNNKATNGTGDQTEFGSYEGLVSGCGGGLYLYQGLIDMNLCTMDNNTAKLNGGGANNHAGNINVQSCYIRNNEAGKNNTNAGSGGGIFTYSGNIGVNIWGTPATLQNEARRTEITGNKARMNGGGLNTHNGKILVQGNSDDANERILINNNEATSGSGGAIFCMGEPATGGANTNFITLQYVDLKGNKAFSGTGSYVDEDNGETISKGCGGGVYLQLGEIKATDVVMQNNFANRNGGAINNHDGFVDIYGCIIGGDDYYDGSLTDGSGHGNKAGNSGGGIYTNRGNIDVEDYIEHSQGASKRFTSKLNYNWAEENGGALNTHSGTVWVNKNERDDETPITYNKAKKGGGIYANSGTIFLHNAHVDNNTATENGGGANNHAGDINIYGGTVNNNTAQDGHGGGVFTYVGDVNILPFPSTLDHPTRNDGTQVFNNLAKQNGGGINNHTGRVDARYASLRNNTASLGNGGGIFCEGPHGSATGFTIRLLNSELKENKTRGEDGTAADPTGRGGGIYLKYGSIYAHNSQIVENKANINGGGLDNHDGAIRVYGCEISDNRAENGRGGGIYTQTGSITTGPSLVGSSSNATLIKGNYAKINGGGINNHHGDIFLNGDHILENIAEEGDGGGIYIANGTIDMFGGKVADNTAGNDGGGVWSGGGVFNIQKREGKPVVAVMDVEIVSGTEAIVHYHLIDKGSADVTRHGINVVGGSETDFNPSTPGHSMEEEGCYRITLTGLTAGTTYKITAYAENAKGETESEEIEFTTFDANPSVISGTVANITKNSAEGSGKLLKSNGATECGVIYVQKDNLSALSELTHGASGVVEKKETGTFNDNYFFTLELSPLESGKKYYARAYAKNSAKAYAYGDTVSFVTKKNTPDLGDGLVVVDPAQITMNDAHFSFTIPSTTTLSAITSYGFVISEDNDPEIHADSDHTIVFNGAPSSYTFAKKASEHTPEPIVLKPGTTYYVRAFASNIENPGTDVSNYSLSTPTQFITKDADGKPLVKNIALSNITQHAVDVTGVIKDGGTSAVIAYGIVWSRTNEQPEVGADGCYNYEITNDIPGVNVNKTLHMPEEGLDTLMMNTTYHVRTYAKNTSGIGYSNKFNFTTLPANAPEVIINEVVDITKTSAKAICAVNDGGSEVTDWGLKWSATDNIADATNINKPGTTLTNNTFEVELTGLYENTNYYLWVYATNGVGTHTTSHYVRFKTAYDIPDVVIQPVTAIAYDANAAAGQQNTATFNAKVTPQGSQNVKTYGVCWSTSDNPLRMTSDYTDSGFEETTGDLTSALEYSYANKVQKYSNTKYYVRAYASLNEPDADNKLAEIVYSPAKQEFVTLPSMKTDGASTITHNSATLGGTIVSRDINGYLMGGKYGICWGIAANPTKGEDNFVEGDINAANGNTFPYTLNATGLTPNTTYYYRAYYYKGEGNIAYAKQAASTFTTKSYVLNVVSANEAQGTVNPTLVGLNQGEHVSVYANPVAGYKLDYWTASSGTISGNEENPVTFYMGTENATLTATFKVATYDITLIASPDGGGTVSGGGTGLSYNSPVSITAVANSGYTFVNWTLNGEEVSTEPTYGFNVTGDATYVANFIVDEDGKGNTSMNATPAPRPRDIYPAPATEPWDWDDDFVIASEAKQSSNTKAWIATACGLAMTETDSIIENDTLAERGNREELHPIDYPIIEKNTAEAGRGGGIFMTNNDATPTKLIFAGGETEETKGKIILNYAAEGGGGIFIDTNAYMQMKGHCEVNGNWVNHGKTGGGVYLVGRLYIGENPTDAVDKHALKVNRNFAFDKTVSDETYTELTTLMTSDDISSNPADKERNNIFLSRNNYSFNHTANAAGDDDANVLALLSDISGTDGDKPYTSLGFNVGHGFCPAIATSYEFGKEYNNAEDGNSYQDPSGYATLDEYEAWLASLMPTGKLKLDKDGSIFEDTDTYIAIHTQFITQPFRSKFIYLWGSWTNPAVSTDPETKKPMKGSNSSTDPTSDPDWQGHYVITNPVANTNENDTPLEWEIYSAEGLAWFCNYVNGLNSFKNGDANNHKEYKETKNSKAIAKLMADIDLEAHLWVPIGSVTKFNGDDSEAAAAIAAGTSALYTDDDDHLYNGTFDGNGHYITGIDCRYLTGIKKFGVFGELGEGAVVKNLFVDSCKYMTDKTNVGYKLGGIAAIVGEGAAVSACEARSKFDVAISQKSETYVGGIAGEIKSGGLVHSTVGIPIIKGATAYTGGLAGYVEAGGSLYNSFANPLFPDEHYPDTCKDRTGTTTINIYIGGLVGVSNGNVENNYSRLQDKDGDHTPDEPKDADGNSLFGWLVGTNNNNALQFCYAPYDRISAGGVYKKDGNDPKDHGSYEATALKSNKYGFKHRDQKIHDKDGNLVETNYNAYANERVNKDFRGGLQTALMNWVNEKNEGEATYHPWMRSMATTINDDLPIHNFKKDGTSKALTTEANWNAVGSKDNIYLDYRTDVNDLLTEYVALAPAIYPTPAVYLYDANTENSEPKVKVSNAKAGLTHPNVVFAIKDDVGITVTGEAADVSTGLKARVGAVLQNFRKNDDDYTSDPNWHLFSSAVKDVSIGLVYNYDKDSDFVGRILGKDYHTDNVWSSHEQFDPPMTSWYQSQDPSGDNYAPASVGYFPTNTPYGSWRGAGNMASGNLNDEGEGGFYDFYEYNEEYYHWINYKRSSYEGKSDHWHLDHDGQPAKNHFNIPLFNDETFRAGKGYLIALSSESMMMADGILNVNEQTTTLTRSSFNTHSPNLSGYDQEWRSLGLLGNPYQSYLDFDEFIEANDGKLAQKTYAVRDDDDYSYKFYTSSGSKNSAAPDKYIHPHQGFFIKLKPNSATTAGSVLTENITFNEDMRKAGKGLAPFRGGLDYPLVNLFCTDEKGKGDYTTVEIGRPDEGGGEKMKNLHIGDGLIYARWNDTDYQTLFTPVGVSTVPVRFSASENGTYTITWTLENGQFNYVHLIDNLSGADVDCLTATEYKFEGNKNDYLSRFKLVFDCVGVEENEDPDPENIKPFAFQFGEELIVNGNGYVEMFDVTGRRMMTGQANGGQSSFGLPKVAAGVYVLRLTDNGKSRVQKIVIERN